MELTLSPTLDNGVIQLWLFYTKGKKMSSPAGGKGGRLFPEIGIQYLRYHPWGWEGGLILRSVDTWLDRFSYKHPNLGIPRLMLYVVVGNLIVFFFDQVSSGTFSAMLMFLSGPILHGEVWRLITFIFVPLAGNPVSLALFLYCYYFIGTSLEREWGPAKFTLFYFTGVFFNIVVGFITGFASMDYVNMSMFFAFATLYPDTQFLLFFFLPVKAKWLAWLDAAWFLWEIFQIGQSGAYLAMLLPVVAILNYFLFFWSDIRTYVGGNIARSRYQNSRQVVNFKAAQRKARETKGYLHKCAVCGKTDADDPNMEFRYCSKCEGYHCYCMDHINDHVHVTH